ncbi:hypothetical protein F2Q70_00031793 [Brassica cretica]|uniref:Uncharacterized protein n=1 Tax=Brassica cretica TaxID=69181 RepID=A0A8S9FMD1_BRACR|nr:hypothetical protein F2Q70_00031793 [Brassica cretica]
MDGDLTTIRLSPSLDTRYSFYLFFECHRFEVNQHHVSEVMPVLLKSGQSASREKAVEEMQDLLSIDETALVSIDGSLTSWEEIERAFLYKFLDDAEATREKEKNDKWDRLIESRQIKRDDLIPRQLVDYIIAEDDEHHGSEEQSRVDKAGKGSSTSTSTNETTSTSTDGTTSTSTDDTTSTSTDGTTSTSTDSMTSTSTDGTTSTSTDGTTSMSTNGTTSEPIAHTIPASIDRDSCFRSTPLEFHERSSCPQNIADSTHKSTDLSSCDPTSDGDREITMEVFLELEEFLELKDGEKLEDLDSSREVTMEDFLELEEWLEDMD